MLITESLIMGGGAEDLIAAIIGKLGVDPSEIDSIAADLKYALLDLTNNEVQDKTLRYDHKKFMILYWPEENGTIVFNVYKPIGVLWNNEQETGDTLMGILR